MKRGKPILKSPDLYNRRTTINLIIVVAAFSIALASVYYTRILVNELKIREQRLIELYAKTLEYTANETNAADLAFVVQEILVPNNSIPVIWTDGSHHPIRSRNLNLDPGLLEEEKQRILQKEIREMEKEHEPIMLTMRDENGEIYDIQYVYYKNSELLNRLEFYPHVQLSVIAIFGIIAYITFHYSKTAEQNRVWVGLAKETAHQLGTPISSLMAWIEYFKEDESIKNKEVIGELQKDIRRLEMITERFSNIGSVPILYHENIPEVIGNNINYLKSRISKKVEINIHAKPSDIRAKINKPLFDWVIENLCKNAVDSMGGVGKIDINIKKSMDDKVIVDIADTGKGIPKSKLNNVFAPGYSTKARGWGLGLTLAKRIIEKYHKGRIFVKSTEMDQGTTFRILLRI